jgi:hypothetical protein
VPLSLVFTDRVISRSVLSCVEKAHSVNKTTRAYFTRYASYAIDLLESRLDAAEQSWFPRLSEYDQELSERTKSYEHLRQTCRSTREALNEANSDKAAGMQGRVTEALRTLWDELEPVLTAETTLLSKIGPRVSTEDVEQLEEEDKKRRVGMMKKDGHLWCATYLMRCLSAEEREQFPPGVPNMAKSAMLMAGNWQFSRSVATTQDLQHPILTSTREFQFAPRV